MVRLTLKLQTLLLYAPKITGAYDTSTLAIIEESLTSNEWDAVRSFFKWLTTNNLAYGHGNLRARWQEWQATQ